MTSAEEAKLWMRNGDGDFAIINACLRTAVTPWNLLCFRAQQGAEIYLKALLILNSQEPPRTHDLSQLLDLAVRFSPNLAALRPDCHMLNPYAGVERYALTQITEQTARDTIRAGNRVRDALRELLP